MGVEQKTSFGSISSFWRALALFPCKQRARVLFGDGFAGIGTQWSI